MTKHSALKISILAAALAAALPAAASTSAITFKPIPRSGSTVLWLNSVIRPAGIPLGQPVTLCVTQQVITYKVGRDTFTIDIPDAKIQFKPWETASSTNFSTQWETSVPSTSGTYETFVSGSEYASALLPAGSVDMTWSAKFEADTAGVSVAWRWGGASYLQFTDNENAMNVVATDIRNFDRAGTPYAFKSYVWGGDDADANDWNDTSFTGTRSYPTNAVVDQSAGCVGVY